MENVWANFPRLPYSLSPGKRDEISKRVAEKLVDRVQNLITMLENQGVMSMTKLSPDAKLLAYTSMTQPQDFVLLQTPNILMLQRQGQAPPFVSPRWASLATIPDIFEHAREEFLKLYAGS